MSDFLHAAREADQMQIRDLAAENERLQRRRRELKRSMFAIAEQRNQLQAERDAWVRRFNRLDAAISHHKKGKSAMFVDEVDEALYAARDRILRDASREGS